MAQLLIRNLDDRVVERLKKRAKRDGRSLQSEVRMILEREARPDTVDMATARELLAKIRIKLKGKKFPDSVDLIREDRDR